VAIPLEDEPLGLVRSLAVDLSRRLYRSAVRRPGPVHTAVALAAGRWLAGTVDRAELASMEEIRRMTVPLPRAPFTRRA
jgi:hypothetical protein